MIFAVASLVAGLRMCKMAQNLSKGMSSMDSLMSERYQPKGRTTNGPN